MATGVVKGAINAVLEDRLILCTKTKDVGQALMQKVIEGEREIGLFDEFCDQLVSHLDATFYLPKKFTSLSSKKATCWSKFHAKRRVDLPKLWYNLLTSLGLEVDEMLTSSITQELFKQMLANYVAQECRDKEITKEIEQIVLTTQELNAMQYVCGFVPFKLLKRFKTQKGRKAEIFVECLTNLAVTSSDADDSTDFLLYTKVWFDKVNRGGLFSANDKCFNLFIAMEKIVRVILPRHIKMKKSTHDVEGLIKEVLKDDDVQFFWALLSLDFESDDDAQELLYEIVRLWITIRGHSIASTWVEAYKQATKQTIKKSTGLRKQLS